MAELEIDSPEAEHRYHTYRGHQIPFIVRLIWVGFYSLAIFYVIRYMFPSIQQEFRSRISRPAAVSKEKSAEPAKEAAKPAMP
ncbi:MAG: hypothetical protein U1D30_27075 [Planctomycetota bacterium]